MDNTRQSQSEKKSGFLLQGGILAAASLICRVIGLIYRLPLTRIIGDDGNGLYGCAFEVYNIALLLSSYSLPLAVSKLVATRLAKGERKNAFRVFKGALIFAAVAGSLAGLLIFAFAGPIASDVMNSPMSMYALRVLAPGLLIVAVMGVLRGYFQGYGSMIPTAVSQILEQIVNAAVSILAASYLFKVGMAAAQKSADADSLLAPAYGAAGGTCGTVSGALAGLLFLGFTFFVFYSRSKGKLTTNRGAKTEDYPAIYRVLFATIIPVILSSAIYNLCNILDQAIFNHCMAWQGVAYKTYNQLIGMYTGKFIILINVPLAIANAVASSSIPSLSHSVALGQQKMIHEKIGLAVRFAMLIAIPSCIGYAVLGSPILRLLFNDDRTSMALILASGAVMVVFYSLSTVTNAILQGLNHMMYPIKNALISLVIHVASLLVMLLVFKWNIYAVVFANCIFALCMCLLNQRDIHRITGYRQEMKRTFVMPFFVSLIMGAAARGVYQLFRIFAGNLVSTGVSLIAAVALYALLLIKAGIVTETEMMQLPKGRAIVSACRKIHLIS